MSRDGVQQQVLYGGEENLRRLVALVVVAAQGKQVAHLLVEALLRGTDVPDARQHFIEVVRAAIRVLQTLVVQHEALEQILLEHRGRPAAELHPARRAHPVAHGQDGVEVVERDRTLHLARTFDLNYRGILGSCLATQLPIFKDVLQMQADIVSRHIEQLGHFQLCQPFRLLIGPQPDLAAAVFGGIENQFAHDVYRKPAVNLPAPLLQSSLAFDMWQTRVPSQHEFKTVGGASRRDHRMLDQTIQKP